jgi:hypothetical protein
MTLRKLSFAQTIQEATDLCVLKDATSRSWGLGVPEPMGIVGTTWSGATCGSERVSNLPTSGTAFDRAFQPCARTWPSPGRMLAAPYLFLKLRRAHLWRRVGRRLAHARLSLRSE